MKATRRLPTPKAHKGLGDLYRPSSRAKSLGVDTPDSMSYEIHQSLERLKKAVGNVDDFVQARLKYPSMKALSDALSAEQIDAVALAIYNIEAKRQGIIIGDQTGIGKGRIAAAMIRYGVQQGLKPVFITEKPNLFSDLYRDLKAIGSAHLRPFIVNAKESKTLIKDENGVVVYEPLEKTALDRVLKSAHLPTGFDYVMLTYSQISEGEYNAKGQYVGTSAKLNFVRSMAEKNILVMDESHNAAGESNTGKNLQGIVSASLGVTFLSATFAKRPDNMPIYALKTAMSETNLSNEGLTEAIKKGGVALQEIISSQLVGQGQMIRRERSYEGIEVNYLTTEEFGAEQKQTADAVTGIMRDIIAFQETYVKPEISSLNRIVAAEQGEVKERQGTSKAGVDNSPYFSKVFQAINQMLLAVKAKSVAARAIARLKQGKKPVIAFSNTMGSFLESLQNDDGTPVGDGDKINADFATVLIRGLEGVLRYTVHSANGSQQHELFDISQFSSEAQESYRGIVRKINTSSTGIVISPIDLIIQEIEKAGYSIAEVTGRKYKLVLEERKIKPTGLGKGLGRMEPKSYVGTVQLRKRENTNDAFRRFNDNEVDVLMINQAGSTGASAHAVATRKVPASQVRQRVMIVLQAELDINTEVQKRGRINRTGQLIKPIYDYVSCAVPAEKRLMMMLQKKLKSLDANTSSNQKNSEALLKSDDFLNKYGDVVVLEYLRENPEFNEAIGDPLNLSASKSDSGKTSAAPEDLAHRVSGRVAVLSTREQEEFYEEILRRYHHYLELLLEQDEYDLEVEVQDLKAETQQQTILVANSAGGGSPFSDHTYLEQCEVAVLKKPLTASEVEKKVEKELDGKTPLDYSTDLIQRAKTTILKRVAELEGQEQQKYEQLIGVIAQEKDYQKRQSPQEQQAYLRQREAELREALAAKIQAIKVKYNNEYRYLYELIQYFYPSRQIYVPGDVENASGWKTYGVVLGIKVGGNKRNPFAPSNLSIQLALASSKRQLTIDLGPKNQVLLYSIKGQSPGTSPTFEQTLQGWKGAIAESTKDRNTRYIATGNLLQFFGQLALPRAKLIQFSTLDGKIRKGALLPESYSPKGFDKESQQRIIVPLDKCVPLIRRLSTKGQLVCSHKLVIMVTGGGYRFMVPASRQLGGGIYLDAEVLEYVQGHDFQKVSNLMVAVCTPDKLSSLCEVLGRKLKVSAEVSQQDFQYIESEFSIRKVDDEVKRIEVRPSATDASKLEAEARARRIRIIKMKYKYQNQTSR
ncbi:strawberry notch-like NTP hydrolase domain-containing protein [Emticicia sp. 17c]|uniref:strawberry notch-like NTP hydrolase domain-containing protein n=1 Tax=Emticicia sp. 17c TaxID=3127704 RepID=UPI00301CAA23